MNENLKNKIADELGIESAELTNEKLLDDLEPWDSVTLLILSVILSDEAATPITPTEMRELRTYVHVEALVKKKKVANL